MTKPATKHNVLTVTLTTGEAQLIVEAIDMTLPLLRPEARAVAASVGYKIGVGLVGKAGADALWVETFGENGDPTPELLDAVPAPD